MNDILAKRLAEWNALVDEFNELWLTCWSWKRPLATLEAACGVVNAIRSRLTFMREALVDPERPDEAGDQVRAVRRELERFRLTLSRFPARRRRNDIERNPFPGGLRLPVTIGEVRADYFAARRSWRGKEASYRECA